MPLPDRLQMPSTTPCRNDHFPWRRTVLRRDAVIGEPLIFAVEDDWRGRRFICTLNYHTDALVIEASCPTRPLVSQAGMHPER